MALRMIDQLGSPPLFRPFGHGNFDRAARVFRQRVEQNLAAASRPCPAQKGRHDRLRVLRVDNA